MFTIRENSTFGIYYFSGGLPNVHHKKPLFRCSSNEDPNKIENLELLTEEFHTAKNKELHWYKEGNSLYDFYGKGPNLSNIKGANYV